MARILWACWDGGGNLTPSIGIARVLEDRGHEVHFYGRPEMVDRVEAAGLAATALTHARTDLDRYSFHPLATVFGYTSSPAVGEELVAVETDAHDIAVFPNARGVCQATGKAEQARHLVQCRHGANIAP